MTSAKSNRPPLKVDENDLLPHRETVFGEEDDRRVLAAADQLSARHGALRGSTRLAPSRSPAATTKRAVLSLALPDYLDHELSRRAAEQRVSKLFLILEALAQAGYTVQPGDLIGDRRRKPSP